MAADKCERGEIQGAETTGRDHVLRVLDACTAQIDQPFIGNWPNPMCFAKYIETKDEETEPTKKRKRVRKSRKDVKP